MMNEDSLSFRFPSSTSPLVWRGSLAPELDCEDAGSECIDLDLHLEHASGSEKLEQSCLPSVRRGLKKMGSSIDSSRPTVFRGSQRQRRIYGPNFYGLEVFGNVFAEHGGCFRTDIEDLLPALPHEHGDLQDAIALPQHPAPPAIQPPPEPIDMIDALYAPHFRRLEQELEASIARSSVHVPPFVSAGRVPQGSLEVDTAGVAEPVLLSVLEEYVPANQAK